MSASAGQETSSVRVAVAQPRGYPFAPREAVARVCAWTKEAAANGAQLILFPEAFVGGYPWGLSFGTAVGGRTPPGRRTFGQYHASAITVPGPETEEMARVARDEGVFVAVGVIEREGDHGGTLFCTLVYITPEQGVVAKHRKLKPTAAERLIWGEGDGSTLAVVETSYARVGGLICWENYMPLARTAMYGKGVEIYLAPTADSRDRWQATLRHIALEGRCFVLGCNQFVTKDHYPDSVEILSELDSWPHVLCPGGSAIYSPLGEPVANPLLNEEGILYGDLDLSEIERARFDFDAMGHYARPDVFQLHVNEAPLTSVSSWEEVP